jgi:hypothetical protein
MADGVNFTRPAAERIAKAVRTIEFGDRDSTGPDVDRPWSEARRFKLTLGRFTGVWQTATFKTVTYTVGTATATAQVYNYCNPALLDAKDTASTTKTRAVLFGRVGSTNAAVEIQLRTADTCTLYLGTLDLTKLTGYSANDVQLLGHNTTGPCLQWYSITTCSTAAV